MMPPSPLRDAAAMQGYLCLVLHAHLPFVRHPEQPYMLEENWLFEGLTETYLPLLSVFDNCVDDGVPFRMTMSLSPTLCSMLGDPLLQERYAAHLSKLIELAELEIVRTRRSHALYLNAQMYYDKFRYLRYLYTDVYGGDVIRAFKKLQERGVLELMTCGATHAYLPNMQQNPKAIAAQIHMAVESYATHFSRPPAGIWLPECGYFPGLEKILHKAGLRYFCADSHALTHADPPPVRGVYAPVICQNAPVAVFARDSESSQSVWSADHGYPGHGAYREFYRDIGFELDMKYIGPYIDPAGIRIATGLKYHRITSRNTPEKQPYERAEALRIASEHAGNFMYNRELQVAYLAKNMDRPPIILAPYDAELFGHWWYEGPEWLNYLIRKIAFEQDTVSMITPSEYLARFPENHKGEPSLSSWGDGGYSAMWIDPSNDWVYRYLSRMEEQMSACAQTYPDAQGIPLRALNQMARELMLAESSDWAFIMKTGTTVAYAKRRTKEHIANFAKLYDSVQRQNIDVRFVELLEWRNNIFPAIHYRLYA